MICSAPLGKDGAPKKLGIDQLSHRCAKSSPVLEGIVISGCLCQPVPTIHDKAQCPALIRKRLGNLLP